MTGLLHDIRYALRQLRKSPGFTSVAVLTLALGIGANTAIFSVINAVILRPLPYRDPGQLVLVRESIPMATPEPIPVSAPDVLQLQQHNRVFDGVAGFAGEQLDLSGQGTPQRVPVARVNASLFPTLGVEPLIGRAFSAEEDAPGHLLAVLSYGLWQRRFAGSDSVLGQTVTLNRETYTVIGVMPRGFAFPLPRMAQGDPADVFVPMAFTPDELKEVGDNFNYGVVARVRPGVSLARVSTDLGSLAHRIQETYPAQFRDSIKLGAVALPLKEHVTGDATPVLLLLLGAVGFVLLIACANIANLLLGRAADRQREIAVRRALGAGGLRLFRQSLAESMLLALMGAGAGLALAFLITRAVAGLMPTSVPLVHPIAVDPLVLAFTLALALLTGLAFGVVPAVAGTRTELSSALKEGGRSAMPGRQHQFLRGALVVGEIALSLVLLVGAGLLVRSFERVLETDPGFEPEHVLTASLSLPDSQYKQAHQVRNFYEELMLRMERLPGVKMAGASTDLPLEGHWLEIFTPEGYQPAPGAGLNTCSHSTILGNYLQTMGVPLIRGRYFSEQDTRNSIPVVIVSESLAQRYWPNQDPIGKRMKQGPPESSDPWLTIVGVVGDVKQGPLDTETMLHTYGPYSQAETNSLNVAVRAGGDPAALGAELRTAVWSLDRELAVGDVRTMDQVIQESTAPRRFNLFLVAAFAALAMVLASIGIYGVIANVVARRTHEIGIRVALGAGRGNVLRLVVGQGARLAALGMAIGLFGALGLTRLLSSYLYEIHPTDGVTFAAVIGLVGAVACLASYIPARRAAKVDPMVALRYE